MGTLGGVFMHYRGVTGMQTKHPQPLLCPVVLGTLLRGWRGIGSGAAGHLPGHVASASTGSGAAILLACCS